MMMVTINNQLISLEILNCNCGNVFKRALKPETLMIPNQRKRLLLRVDCFYLPPKVHLLVILFMCIFKFDAIIYPGLCSCL